MFFSVIVEPFRGPKVSNGLRNHLVLRVIKVFKSYSYACFYPYVL